MGSWGYRLRVRRQYWQLRVLARVLGMTWYLRRCYCLLFIVCCLFPMISSHLLPLPLSSSFGFLPSAVFPVWLRIVPCVWATQVVRKLSRRTKGKCSGSVADVGVEKRPDGCQTIVEVEEPCDFPTILHTFSRFSKNS